MPEFVYYEVLEDAATPALRKRLFEVPNLRMRPNAEATGWLVRSSAPVPRFDGRRIVKEGRWAASLAAKPLAPAGNPSPDLIALPWKIAPGTRQARIARVLLAPKRSALQLTFGEGSGDAVSIEAETPLPGGVTRLGVELRASSGVTLSVVPSLRSGRGRPLLALEGKPVSPGARLTIDWVLPDLADSERARMAGLSLTLSTEADHAIVFLDAIAFAV